MVLLHHLAELRRDALGQVRRDAAADADDLDVRDRAQILEEILEAPVAQHHRIAAGHDDVANLRMLADVLERRVVLIERDLLRVADLAASRAEAAVARADRAHEEEHAIGIAVRDVRHRRVGVLVERVDDAVDDVELLDRRDVLIPHRVADALDLIERGRRDAHLEVLERRLQRLDIDDVVAELLGQLVQRGDASSFRIFCHSLM